MCVCARATAGQGLAEQKNRKGCAMRVRIALRVCIWCELRMSAWACVRMSERAHLPDQVGIPGGVEDHGARERLGVVALPRSFSQVQYPGSGTSLACADSYPASE